VEVENWCRQEYLRRLAARDLIDERPAD
jgi:hypothetical protein